VAPAREPSREHLGDALDAAEMRAEVRRHEQDPHALAGTVATGAAAAHYDALWQRTWGPLQEFGPVHRHLRADVVRLVGTLGVESVLDVGCGSGDLLLALAAEERYELAGADVSREALDRARERLPVMPFELLDVERAALPARYDLVLSVQVVEHLDDDVRALANMAAMASRFVLVSTIGGRMRPSERAIGHRRNYTEAELAGKLERAGLSVVDLFGWGFPFYSPLYRTLAEWLPRGPPTGSIGPVGRLGAAALYELYRLNAPRRGDVLTALARVTESVRIVS
jgi:2-polyprenyl-3-methyl-5-hydroxy-6-metoxy-1,4-benzoquinol methylase